MAPAQHEQAEYEPQMTRISMSGRMVTILSCVGASMLMDEGYQGKGVRVPGKAVQPAWHPPEPLTCLKNITNALLVLMVQATYVGILRAASQQELVKSFLSYSSKSRGGRKEST